MGLPPLAPPDLSSHPSGPAPDQAGRSDQAEAVDQPLAAAGLLAWRRDLLARSGGSAAELDWLLDLAGGLPWPQLQALHLHPERPVRLRLPLAALEDLWLCHQIGRAHV